MRITNRLPDSSVNISKATPLGNCLKALVGATAVLAAFYFGLALLIDLAVPHVSPEAEQWLSRVFFETPSADSERTPAELELQAMLDGMAADVAGLPYQPVVRVDESPQVNAFALPGGTVVVCSGLLAEVESDNELAFILGHELGHLAHRDHMRGLGRALAAAAINMLCVYVADVEVLPDVMTLYERKGSRSRELAADRFGLDRVHAQYGHVAGAVTFFTRQEAKGAHPAWLRSFSTHPDDNDRIQQLTDHARKSGYALRPPPAAM